MATSYERLSTALADRYRIERELGAGGMAMVYLAQDRKHNRPVAIKVLKPELAAVLGAERFVQEIQTTAARMTVPGHSAAELHWERFSLTEQLANVGSEVDRTIRAWEAGNTQRFDLSLVRALALFDLTAVDDRWRGARRSKVLRAREEFVRLFFDPEVPIGSASALRRYFLAFALATRTQR